MASDDHSGTTGDESQHRRTLVLSAGWRLVRRWEYRGFTMYRLETPDHRTRYIAVDHRTDPT